MPHHPPTVTGIIRRSSYATLPTCRSNNIGAIQDLLTARSLTNARSQVPKHSANRAVPQIDHANFGIGNA